jgi:hypothetical protein
MLNHVANAPLDHKQTLERMETLRREKRVGMLLVQSTTQFRIEKVI